MRREGQAKAARQRRQGKTRATRRVARKSKGGKVRNWLQGNGMSRAARQGRQGKGRAARGDKGGMQGKAGQARQGQ
jgi:hypothetical protein